MQDLADTLQAFFAQYPWILSLLWLLGLVLLAWLSDRVARRWLLRGIERFTRATPMQWDDALLARGVLRHLAHVLPALVLYAGIVLVPLLPAALVTVVRNVALAWVVLSLALAASALLSAINDIYSATPRAQSRPIKSYVQVAKLLVFVLAGVLVVAILIERSPLLLLSGLGAMAAVLMLVFRDTILSLVASVQLSSHDMLRVGDWIEMPALQADGDVIDIALHTVKVQNWDKTITTIPTHRLISEPYRNWRGMQESGGRRIKRALYIDQGTIRYLTPEERERMAGVSLLSEYLRDKQAELEAFNVALADEGKEPVNTRRLTNVGTFRAYVMAYLRHHPGINQGMTLLVRQLEPGPTGLPIQVYCFTRTVRWAEYEAIQSDLFDHLIAILPEFGLRVFQQPGGGDLERGLARMGGQQGPMREAHARLG